MTARVVVLADTGGEDFHVGDEAMLAANVQLLRGVGADVRVLRRDERDDEIASAASGADAALVSGGGNMNATWPELLGQRMALMRAARAAGVPYALTGQTLGPNVPPATRDELGVLLADATLVGVREQASYALARELGVAPERLVAQADDAFLLEPDAPGDPAVRGACAEPYAVASFDASYGSQHAAGALRSLAAQLALVARETGLAIVLLPQVGPLGSVDGADAAVSGTLAALVRLAGGAAHVLPILVPGEAAWVAQGAELTLSSRYHPIVFATAAGGPALGVHRDDYTRVKLVGALAHVGAERWCLDTEAAEAGDLAAAALGLWSHREEVRATAGAALPGLRAQEENRRAQLLQSLGLDGAAR